MASVLNIKKLKLKREAGILGIIYVIYGAIASFASIHSKYGIVGIFISCAFLLLLFIICIYILRSVLVKNARGITMLEAITNAGLVDIENRDDVAHSLPPDEFYSLVEDEVVITGISAYRTFDQNIHILLNLLKSGRKLYVLIMHPDSPDILEITKREGQNIKNDIETVIHVIKAQKLYEHPGFHVKFMWRKPPFTAVMRDGNLEPTGENPRDQKAQIRIQPTTVYNTQHKGLVIQFRNKSGQLAGIFDYFAEDIRNQWKYGKSSPELFM